MSAPDDPGPWSHDLDVGCQGQIKWMLGIQSRVDQDGTEMLSH